MFFTRATNSTNAKESVREQLDILICTLETLAFLFSMIFRKIVNTASLQLSGVVPPPVCRNFQQTGNTASVAGADSSPRSTVNSTIQAPRRKFVDEGKLRKVCKYIGFSHLGYFNITFFLCIVATRHS